MLTVVEHEQEPSEPQGIDERRHQRLVGGLRDAERRGDRLRHQMRFAETGQVDQPGPVWIIRDGASRDLKRQARLADTTRSREREQAPCRKQGLHLGTLALSADEPRHLIRQVRRMRIGQHWLSRRRHHIVCDGMVEPST